MQMPEQGEESCEMTSWGHDGDIVTFINSQQLQLPAWDLYKTKTLKPLM